VKKKVKWEDSGREGKEMGRRRRCEIGRRKRGRRKREKKLVICIL
jgi:hypothetical protein